MSEHLPVAETSRVYDRLRSQILDLDRVPGSRLTERGLEAELGASRTPLRSALMRLESEGLVGRDGRGWQVTPIDLAEIARLSEFRDAVESAAVRLSCARASDAEIAELAEHLGRSAGDRSPDGAVRAGTDFHVRLAALSGNAFFADAVDDAMTRLARARWLVARDEHAADEHREILALVAARRADEAAARIHEHVVGTHDRLVAALGADARSLRGRGLAIVS
ncbi:GntR family transcriptional regulator [Leifsonia sp. 21MFCrub1.1]|uniref:GntR family transcriptional regulator n=1 Tax=Leifsonia sp. 21MFCrub1.1 TaxID=1798223 RepID=UPI0008929EEE|nr:GntR family transcriptional regulator [Leifsonia sp. 21MFCrub1.1]SEA88647.1 DNA-binding transcriptional regulator, GntR family [Leifsonia sp. 21MFCrub1.1]